MTGSPSKTPNPCWNKTSNYQHFSEVQWSKNNVPISTIEYLYHEFEKLETTVLIYKKSYIERHKVYRVGKSIKQISFVYLIRRLPWVLNTYLNDLLPNYSENPHLKVNFIPG